MIRLKHILTAATLALATTPAMATSFVTDPIVNPSAQWAGIDYYGVQVSAFSTLDQVLTFNILSDSKIDIYMMGSPKILFSDILLNGQSIASNFTVGSNNVLEATGYALAGNVSLEFKGDYTCKDCWGDWFGGYVQVTKATVPTATSTAVAAVPEPATWATLVIGFGFIGAAMRRRQQVVSVA